MDRDKLAELRKKKADNKAKLHKELLDSNASIKDAILLLNQAINEQEPISLDSLSKQLEELKALQTYKDDIKRLETAIKASSSENKLDDVIKAVGNINNKDVVSAVNDLVTKIDNQDIKQEPEDYQPVRRVRKIGQRLVFDDDPLQVNVSGGGGGGVPTAVIRNNNSLAVVNPDGSNIGDIGGFAPESTIITDLSVPGIVTQTDGIKIYTATITPTTITEEWT